MASVFTSTMEYLRILLSAIQTSFNADRIHKANLSTKEKIYCLCSSHPNARIAELLEHWHFSLEIACYDSSCLCRSDLMISSKRSQSPQQVARLLSQQTTMQRLMARCFPVHKNLPDTQGTHEIKMARRMVGPSKYGLLTE